MTHARLRAAQGDLGGARRVLAEILAARPDDPDARRVLAELGSRPATPGRPETAEEPLGPPVAGDPRRLALEFGGRLGPAGRARREAASRLERWLGRIRESQTRERTR